MQRPSSFAFLSIVVSSFPRRLVVRNYASAAALAAAKAHSRDFTTPTTTPVDFEKPLWSLDHNSRLFFLGSCFAETLSETLSRKKFQVFANSHGILFNPISIATAMMHATTGAPFDYDSKYVFQDNVDIFHSWLHHSSFSSSSYTALIESINAKNVQAHSFIKQSKVLFLTLGTAFIHELIIDGTVVANCHKQPAKLFKKRLLTVADIVTALGSAIAATNPLLQVVITVSPVRHTREGIVENSRSKAILLLAAHELVDKHPERVRYFPSYELFMDELRDYRWYDADMIHPSTAAQSMVFDIFAETFLSGDAISATKLIDSIHADIQHRPFLQNSLPYRKHLERSLVKTQQAQKDLGDYVDLSEELDTLRSLLLR